MEHFNCIEIRPLQEFATSIFTYYNVVNLLVAHRFLVKFSMKVIYSLFLDKGDSFFVKFSAKDSNSSFELGRLSPSIVAGSLSCSLSPPKVVSKASFKSDSFCLRSLSSGEISSSSASSPNSFSLRSFSSRFSLQNVFQVNIFPLIILCLISYLFFSNFFLY